MASNYIGEGRCCPISSPLDQVVCTTLVHIQHLYQEYCGQRQHHVIQGLDRILFRGVSPFRGSHISPRQALCRQARSCPRPARGKCRQREQSVSDFIHPVARIRQNMAAVLCCWCKIRCGIRWKDRKLTCRRSRPIRPCPPFHEHAKASYVGRPFPLDEAPENWRRLKSWGLTMCTSSGYFITWAWSGLPRGLN